MNYNEKFTQLAYEITAATRAKSPFTYEGRTFDCADRTERMALIERVTYDYMTAHAEYVQAALDRWEAKGTKGQRPATVSVNTSLLERLTDAILHEELTDRHPDKVTRDEYPFMSETQLDERYAKEASDKMAEDFGSDGRNHAQPLRRQRRRHENNFIDRCAKSRNKARADQYRKDTAAGELISYNLADTGGAYKDDFVRCQGVGQRWSDEMSSVYIER